MSLLALKASIGGAPPLAEHPRDLGGKSAGGSEFAAIMSALAGEDPQPNARAAGAKGAANAQDRAPPSENAPKPQESSAIDAGLAGLVYGALAAPVGMTLNQFVPPAAGGKNVAQQGASGLNSAAANGSPAVGGALWRALEGRGMGVSSDQATGSLDAAALAGVVDGPQTVQLAASGDSSLGIAAMRSRTYLGVDSAAQSEARSPIWRSQARSAAQATAPARSGATGTPAADNAAVASTRNETPPDKRSTSGGNGSQSVSVPDPSAGREPAAIDPSASPGAVNLGVNPVTTGVGPIPLGQLAERLATAASALTSRAPASNSAPATGVGSAQAVKELQIDLDPADLGAVSVKMRLVQGKLSVVMEVATPSTLKAIENERGAITDRLGTAAQPLEALIIKASATSQTNAESDNARDRKPGSQENGQNDSNQDAQGNGQQSARREQAAGQRNPQAMARQPAPRGGFGDLLV
jgi:hypothetical protein